LAIPDVVSRPKPGLTFRRKEKSRLIEPLDVGFVMERFASETPKTVKRSSVDRFLTSGQTV